MRCGLGFGVFGCDRLGYGGGGGGVGCGVRCRTGMVATKAWLYWWCCGMKCRVVWCVLWAVGWAWQRKHTQTFSAEQTPVEK